MVENVFNGVFTQRIVEGHTVDGETVACLHGNHPFGAIGAIYSGTIMGGEANGSKGAGNGGSAFGSFGVGEPDVLAVGSAVAETVVVGVFLDGCVEHLKQGVNAIGRGRSILGDDSSAVW